MNKIVLLPDIHGRTFWKNVVNMDAEIIFFGDYVDPYQREGISKETAIENFKEIIDFAKTNNNVRLLYGNHDCSYSMSPDVCQCRFDYDNFEEIRKLFIDNKSLFKLSHSIVINGKKIVFSHAGFHPYWVSKYGITPDNINNFLENEDEFEKLHNALCDISCFRGGSNSVGSVVWSDIREYFDKEITCDYEQIVGHTMLNSVNPIRFDKITCIDLQKPFALNEEGNIVNIDGSKVNIIKVKP